jgi:hypothetical protein
LYNGRLWALSAAQTAWLFSITVIPYLIKPVYGLIPDFVLLFGRRSPRQPSFGRVLTGAWSSESY